MFSVAKNLNDYGWVEKKELRKACEAIGIGNSSFYNWLTDAIKAELFHYVFSGEKHIYKLASYSKAYQIFEIAFVDAQAVEMPVEMLFGKGWLANVWAASNKANFQDKPISQERKAKLTGVPVSTQRRMDKRAKIKRSRSISTSSYDATTGNLQAFKDNSDKKGIFSLGGKIAWHTPSKSHTSSQKIVPVGSRRQMRKLGLKNVPEAVSNSPRLFCENDEEMQSVVEHPSEERDGVYSLLASGRLGETVIWKFEAGL